MKKAPKFLAIVCALALAFSAMALVGCGGNSDEDAVRDVVTKELDSVKNLDAQSIKELSSSSDIASLDDQLAPLGLTFEELMTAIFSGFDYKINSVTVKGDTATANVGITAKDLSNMANDLPNVLAGVQDQKAAGPKILEYLNGLPSHEVTSIDLTLNKGKNGWELDATTIDNAFNAMFGTTAATPQ